MAWHLNLLKNAEASLPSAAEVDVEETLKAVGCHQKLETQPNPGVQAADGQASLTGQCGDRVVVCC